MPPNEDVQIDALLVEVLNKPKDERQEYLDLLCRNDDPLRRELQSLLAANDQAADFLERPAVRGDETALTPICESPGTMIGRYKLLQRIGEGGFGVVYLAEQTEPVRRKVALKIIKPGMDTKQVIARFEAERQALAMMEHPNIARVLDAGATDTGRPYFVMELVKGDPITEYCDSETLSTQDRLELFIKVCHAVQHAHQKGIIHRDIKASNVMVTLHDGKPVPKVIDFGIAKATNARLTERTLFTEYGQMIGTPAYMSPEQAEMSGLDIDTRSDIYSLGVLLYELLTGLTPFDARRLQAAGYDELRRIIREEEPPKPSTRLSGFLSDPSAAGESGNDLRDADRKLLPHGPGSDQGSSAFDIARHRRTDPRSLAKQLRGDLDWVVMKCLEKERARRYETANGLAADLQRHLSDEPVEASPPSARYRFRKFARRNKRLLGSVTGIAAALVIGLTLATYGFITASNERDQKETARAEAEVVTDFLSDMLAAVEPQQEGKDVTVRAVLDKASKDIAEKFADQPLLEARLRATIGEAYRKLGHYSEAEPHLARALDIRQRLLAEEHPDTLSSMNNMANLYESQGRYDEAEALLLETLELRKRVLGEEDHATLASMNSLAIVYISQGRYDDAEALHLKTLEVLKRVLGDEHPSTLASMGNLATLYWKKGRYDDAEPLYLETLEIKKRVLGREHPSTLTSTNSLALVYESQGRYDDAEPLHLEALEVEKRVLGDEHPRTLRSMIYLAHLYQGQGRYDEAEPLYLETLEVQKRVLGDEHPDRLAAMHNLASVYAQQGRYDKAEALFLGTLKIKKRILGEEHPDTLSCVGDLAALYFQQGRYDDAEVLYLDTLEIRKRILGQEHPVTLTSMSNLALLYDHQARYDEAEALHLDTLEIKKRILGEEHPETLASMNNLAIMYDHQGRYDEAEPLYLETLEINKRILGKEHPATLGAMGNLAIVYEAQGRYAEAEVLHLDTLKAFKRVLGEEHPATLNSMHNLASVYDEQGRYDEAEPLYVKTVELSRRVLGEEHPDTVGSMHNLANLYKAQGRYDEAEALFLQTLELRKRVLGEEHQQTLGTMTDLALLLRVLGRLDEAEELYRESLERKRRILGIQHPWTRIAIGGLATVYERQGRADEALPLRGELLEYQVSLAQAPDAKARTINKAAWSLLTVEPPDLRDPQAALEFARQANDLTSYDNPLYLDTLALAYHLSGDTARALETQQEALSLLTEDQESYRPEMEANLAKYKAALQQGAEDD